MNTLNEFIILYIMSEAFKIFNYKTLINNFVINYKNNK